MRTSRLSFALAAAVLLGAGCATTPAPEPPSPDAVFLSVEADAGKPSGDEDRSVDLRSSASSPWRLPATIATDEELAEIDLALDYRAGPSWRATPRLDVDHRQPIPLPARTSWIEISDRIRCTQARRFAEKQATWGKVSTAAALGALIYAASAGGVAGLF